MRTVRSLLCVLILAPVSLTAYPTHIRVQSVSAPSLPSPRLAPVRPVTDVFYGKRLVDPYRYMENRADAEVKSWVKDQNDYTRAVLASLPGGKNSCPAS